MRSGAFIGFRYPAKRSPSSTARVLSARSDSTVFVRRGPGVRFVSNNVANRWLRDLELRDENGRFVTLHGFRSTYRVMAMKVDSVSREISEASLAHQNPDETVRSYARSDVLEPRCEHLQRCADYVVPSEAAGEDGAPVAVMNMAHPIRQLRVVTSLFPLPRHFPEWEASPVPSATPVAGRGLADLHHEQRAASRRRAALSQA